MDVSVKVCLRGLWNIPQELVTSQYLAIDIDRMHASENMDRKMFMVDRIGDKTGKHFADRSVFVRFLAVVGSEYQDQPYHNFTHACDVCHTVYRTLSEVCTPSACAMTLETPKCHGTKREVAVVAAGGVAEVAVVFVVVIVVVVVVLKATSSINGSNRNNEDNYDDDDVDDARNI
eukprot:6489585-Amphidinium_carterae.1